MLKKSHYVPSRQEATLTLTLHMVDGRVLEVSETTTDPDHVRWGHSLDLPFDERGFRRDYFTATQRAENMLSANIRVIRDGGFVHKETFYPREQLVKMTHEVTVRTLVEARREIVGPFTCCVVDEG